MTTETTTYSELRNEIANALSNAGSFCGDCGFEPGDRNQCTDCERHWGWCADKLLPLFRAERAAGIREAAELADSAAEDMQDKFPEQSTGARSVAAVIRNRADVFPA